jgi:hypothetical protein
MSASKLEPGGWNWTNLDNVENQLLGNGAAHQDEGFTSGVKKTEAHAVSKVGSRQASQ